MDLGDNRVRLGITYDPKLGLHGLKIFKEVLQSKKALPAANEAPTQETDLSVSPEFLKLDVRFGISPQLRLDFFSEYRLCSTNGIWTSSHCSFCYSSCLIINHPYSKTWHG
jgi:hypothetical protein